ncbi:MAG: NAD(P)/FAD-dependent oxidoreductase [Hyphomicrobium sp.]
MRERVYDGDLYAFGRLPDTYWMATAGPPKDDEAARLEEDIGADVAIIGGGYAGLSAAHQLTTRHGMSACVLEAGTCIGWGASGMNAGFVSMGGEKLELADMVRRVGEDETRRYWRSQVEAVEQLDAFMASDGADCEPVGDGNLCVAHHPSVAPALAELADTLKRRFGVAAEFLDRDRYREEVHDGPETWGGLNLRPGRAMHPLRLARMHARRARAGGARIYTATEIVDWRREGQTHRLVTAGGASIRAPRVLIATNGYTPNDLAPVVTYRGLPAISSIIVTQAYGDRELDARGFRTLTPIYNSRGLLSYYRRLPDGRILLGGRGDTQGTPDAAEDQARATLTTLRRVLPAFADAEIAFAWRGLVCITARRTLALGRDPDDPSVAFAFGCHGSGTATMPWAGRLAADLLAGAATESDVPALLRGLPKKLPPSNAALRWGLRAAYALYAVRDSLHI